MNIPWIRRAAVAAALLMVATMQSVYAGPPHWNNIDVIRENTEAPRAHFISWASAEGAMGGETFGSSIAMPAMDIVEANAAMIAAVNPPIDGLWIQSERS